jgi:hypothetical protein
VNNWPYTAGAVESLLNQTVPTQVLLILQGVDDDLRAQAERLAERNPRVHVWSHQPPLPSLSASWNAGLHFVWSQGGEVAMVVNNDIVCHRDTIQWLRQGILTMSALFVSAVGVRPEEFDPDCSVEAGQQFMRGGPDFSCFLLSREAHAKYPFDELYVPAYCEDLDQHRRYILGGDGDRIFSINLPFAHYASGTLNTEPEKAAEWARKIGQGSRKHHLAKWGGGANQERYTIPFDAETSQDGVTTADLFDSVREGWRHGTEPVLGNLATGEAFTDARAVAADGAVQRDSDAV